MGTQQALRWLPSASCWPMASGDWKQDECVKAETMIGCNKVDVDKEKCMPVMVRVTAAPPRRSRRCSEVDVVAVLDVSRSMEGKVLVEMKEAMQVVINNLGPNNQLCLVVFGNDHRVALHPKHMTKEGRDYATRVIGDWLSTEKPRDEFGDKSVADALRRADEILKESLGTEGDSSRLGCIMLLSGGKNKDVSTTSSLDKLKFPVHTFGFGADHQAKSFRCIASEYGGTYSFINNGKTKDAFKAFIGGLTSVVARSVNISITEQDGVPISSIVTGSHTKDVPNQGRPNSCHNIQVGDMYAGQTKNFIVYLNTEVSVTTVEKLVTVKVTHQQQGAKEITVTHHDSSLGAEINTAAVAAELVRIGLLDHVTAMANKEDPKLEEELQGGWKCIMDTKEYKDADSTALSELQKDVDEMTKPEGVPYMLSWLSCHEWQRATTMSHHSCAFKVRATSTSAAWGWKLNMSRRSCLTLVGVLFLLALLVTTLLRLYLVPDIIPIQPTALDIKRHPSWPTMSNNLGHLLQMTKEGQITSFFEDQKASSHDMNQEINRYLYMAVVYASVLRAHYEGTADISEKVVRHQAEVYLHSMLQWTKQFALPPMEDTSPKHVAGEMSHYLYSTIVQTNVLVAMHEPDKDKKIRQLEEEILNLRIEITTLRTQKDSCCQSATKCREKVKALGGSVDSDETYVIDRTVYYDQVKEIPSLK